MYKLVSVGDVVIPNKLPTGILAEDSIEVEHARLLARLVNQMRENGQLRRARKATGFNL